MERTKACRDATLVSPPALARMAAIVRLKEKARSFAAPSRPRAARVVSSTPSLWTTMLGDTPKWGVKLPSASAVQMSKVWARAGLLRPVAIQINAAIVRFIVILRDF
ncbi:hypothetical protein GCM10010520_51660 [Rhizobium viscosum]|uniref:Uncharacterized protein n=1 Tax=Rhizobium viscosum TaxID=1673 RepID=A0ABR9IZA7_RHIVS|nr:hypothetical protein [Rhizobium viscosum]MBE1508518.1 hypothetical protein [Rhizobium viscosum]